MTRAYWYSVSASSTTRPFSAAFTVPFGSAISTASTSGTTSQRRGSAGTATSAHSSAKVWNVRCVPTSGISSSEEANVPTSDPTVEIAYIRPAVSPDPSTLRNFNRIAHGDTAPNNNTGAATNTNTPNNDPANAPTDTRSNASTDNDRNGSATTGTNPNNTDATTTNPHNDRKSGRRSANRPPNQYPTDNATNTTAIVFAHTTVDAPKNGAINRAAAISAPNVDTPTTNTNTSSRGRPSSTGAAGS